MENMNGKKVKRNNNATTTNAFASVHYHFERETDGIKNLNQVSVQFVGSFAQSCGNLNHFNPFHTIFLIASTTMTRGRKGERIHLIESKKFSCVQLQTTPPTCCLLFACTANNAPKFTVNILSLWLAHWCYTCFFLCFVFLLSFYFSQSNLHKIFPNRNSMYTYSFFNTKFTR